MAIQPAKQDDIGYVDYDHYIDYLEGLQDAEQAEAQEPVEQAKPETAPPKSKTQIAVRTSRFRDQHAVLLTMATELDHLSATLSNAAEAKAARDHLNRLAGKLVVHLAKEDKSLYPQLLKSDSEEVVALTKRYIREMGDLAATFDQYNRRWVSPDAILKNRQQFQTETSAIVEALAIRIEQEDNELYVLADAL